jgi:galactokinase
MYMLNSISEKNGSTESKIRLEFSKHFDGTPFLICSPGRINLIGEHTDYNEGFVLPAAIDKAIIIAVGKRKDDEIHLYSQDFNEHFTTNVNDVKPVKSWATYILGVVCQLQKAGYDVKGFNMVIGGDIPIGAGLSSSAAVECATAYALNELFEFGIEKMAMVKMAQIAEHEFAGVKCGIMDQFTSMFGKKGHVIKLDCRSLEYEYFPLDIKGYTIVLLDTQVKHSLASSEYNIRRSECEQGVAIIQQKYPRVKSLRDASIEQVEACLLGGNEKVYHRCKYVVEEILRLLEGTKDLEKGDVAAFGKKMFATHDGLSNLYEVSCPELDILVDAVRNNSAVLGARMMGGGFGGCTINLVKTDKATELILELAKLYNEKAGKEMKAWKVNIEEGTHIL